LKEDNCQPRSLSLTKLYFIIEGEIKITHDKLKLKEFINSKPTLQKIKKSYTQNRKINATKIWKIICLAR
jgi:hypothetical protein